MYEILKRFLEKPLADDESISLRIKIDQEALFLDAIRELDIDLRHPETVKPYQYPGNVEITHTFRTNLPGVKLLIYEHKSADEHHSNDPDWDDSSNSHITKILSRYGKKVLPRLP